MNQKTIFTALLLVMVFLPIALPASAILGATNLNSNFNTAATFMNTVKNVANFIIAFITILGIIVIVASAIPTGADEAAAERNKSMLTYGLVGLFVAACAYILEQLVLSGIVG
jgi:hypothetical protein